MIEPPDNVHECAPFAQVARKKGRGTVSQLLRFVATCDAPARSVANRRGFVTDEARESHSASSGWNDFFQMMDNVQAE